MNLKLSAPRKAKSNIFNIQSSNNSNYMTNLPPKLMYIVVRIRCGMLNTIHDRPYLYKAERCRVCGIEDESLHHILNCYVISDRIQTVSQSIYTDEIPMDYAKEVAQYVEKFYDAEEEVSELR